MTKKIISGLLTFMLMTSNLCAFAAEATPITTTMTIDDAIAYALEHSLTIDSAKTAVEAQQYTLSTARQTQDQLKKVEDWSAAGFEEGLMVSGFTVTAARTQTEIAKRNLLTAQNNLTIQVKSDFYTYLSAKEKITIARTNLQSAQEKLTYAQAKKESGTISELDYLRFALAVKEAQNALNQAERAADLSALQMKFTLNYPQENELILEGVFQMPAITVKSADDAVLLSKSHVTYLTLQDSLTLAEERWQKARNWYFPTQLGYSLEQTTYQTAQADFQKNVNELEMGIRKTFDGLQTLKENVQYTEESVALLQRSTEAAKLQYEMGMITANDYIDRQQQFFHAQNQYKDLQLSYLITALQYRAMYTYTDDGSIQ